MGLLQKASEHKLQSPDIRRDKFPEVKERLLKVNSTIDLYPYIFKEFIRLFSIEKGALLIREGDIFTLSSIIGFDETTKQRLRLSYDEFNAFENEGNIGILQKYFSIREFVTTNDIYIIPFSNSKEISALLLITEFNTEIKPDIEEIKSYSAQLEELIESNPLHKLKGTEDQSSNIKHDVTSYLQKVKNSENRVIFIRMNINNMIKSFKKMDILSTEGSIKSSVLKILTSFSKNRGKVFPLYNNDILLTLIDRKESINVMMIQQQINAAFKTIFSTKLDSVDLNFETLIWKNNSLDTILDHFLQYADN